MASELSHAVALAEPRLSFDGVHFRRAMRDTLFFPNPIRKLFV